jgi:hypothetical protein
MICPSMLQYGMVCMYVCMYVHSPLPLPPLPSDYLLEARPDRQDAEDREEAPVAVADFRLVDRRFR